MSSMMSVHFEGRSISINPDLIATVDEGKGNTSVVTLNNGESFKLEIAFSKVVRQINAARSQ